jgi:hypothetical protein
MLILKKYEQIATFVCNLQGQKNANLVADMINNTDVEAEPPNLLSIEETEVFINFAQSQPLENITTP